MSSRRVRLWDAVVERADGDAVSIEHVCAVVLDAAGVDGATVVVTLASGMRETVYVTGEAAADIEELIETLGQGPGVDAAGNGPILADDLGTDDCQARWPTFAPAAVLGGTRAAFGFPLQVGGIRLGVMDLYRAAPGGLHPDRLADTLILADAVCTLLLDFSGRSPDVASPRWLDHAGSAHPEVHQATGMITVQLGVSAAVALVRRGAYAFAHDRRLRDVAADVVARVLRFDPGDDDE